MQVQLSCTAGESVDSASHYSNPAPFYDRKPSGEPVWESLRGGAVSRASRPAEPEPNWPKVCVITSSIIIAKVPPFARCTLKTFESSVAYRC